MSVREAFDGEQMFAYMAWWTRCGHDQYTFCAFVDIRKALTLVRLHQAGVTEGMWRMIANFFCGTLSQVRARGEVSSPWVDTGTA